jgi:polyphosphate kinase
LVKALPPRKRPLRVVQRLLHQPRRANSRDTMLEATDSEEAPWYIVRSDDKRRARLNCISHLLDLIPYEEVPRDKVRLPKRSTKKKYDDQATLKGRKFVAEKY